MNQLPGGQVGYRCRADDATKVNAAGDHNHVIGSEAKRAAISNIPGGTFLPFPSTETTPRGRPWPLYVLILGNILVNPRFAHPALKVAQAADAPATAAAMSPYYPRVSTCALATLTTKGLSACVTR